MPEYRKLVRDRIPEIIEASGRRCEVEVLQPDAYLRELDRKLSEELSEYLADGNVHELADMVEVIYAILQFKGVSTTEFEELRLAKAAERGGFDQRLFLVRVSD